MATQILVKWNPPADAITQSVEYKRDIDAIFTEAVNNLGPAVNEYAIAGVFEDNRIYVTVTKAVCGQGGGTMKSSEKLAIKFVCPELALTKTAKSVTVGFAHLGKSINQYIIKLLDAAGTNTLDSRVVNGAIPEGVSETFTGDYIKPGTLYKVRVELYAGILSKLDCDPGEVTTTDSAACAAPEITGATVS